MLDAPAVGWVISVLILSLGCVFFVIPCWVRLWQWRSEHHIITLACLLLLIPDLVMIVDFVPIHIRDLWAGYLVDDAYCKTSSFLICACILASNVGNITVAYVTRRMLDPSDQKVTVRTLYVSGCIGWLLGLALASYFQARGYLGSHRGVYCCTNQVRRGDIAGPVFTVFAVCIAAMVGLYHRAYVQVASVVMPSSRAAAVEQEQSQGSDKAVGAGGGARAAGQAAAPVSARKPTTAITSVISGARSSESREAEETMATIAAAQGQQQLLRDDQAAAAQAVSRPAALLTSSSPTAAARSPTSATAASNATSARSPTSRPAPAQSAAQLIARRAVMMVVAYYACWSLISLNAVFDIAGWDDRSLWWDVVAACCAKLQPSIDAYILLQSMTKVHEKKQAAKLRSADTAVSPRLQVKVDGSQLFKSAAMSPRGPLSEAFKASPPVKSRLLNDGAVSPRGTSSALGIRPSSARVEVSPRAAAGSSPYVARSARENAAAVVSETDADGDVPAASTVTHRRTASSDIVQYQ